MQVINTIFHIFANCSIIVDYMLVSISMHKYASTHKFLSLIDNSGKFYLYQQLWLCDTVFSIFLCLKFKHGIYGLICINPIHNLSIM